MIKDNFGSIWPVHLSAFTRLLTALRAHFDGDLDMLLIMATIGERTRPEHWASGLTDVEKLTRGAGGRDRQLPINVQSIADYARIPRETVRRKVSILQDKGLVLRAGDGRLSVAPEAASLLAGATSDTLEYLRAICGAMEDAARRSRAG
ncbi:hypothetical protein [Maliponia aquimaris]|uniref:hypothetical protein n=1 Tax=Maliponia aquimaris TaxID=1673631 RepID=UPI00114030B1|nr:hypothetical protein [Maliponia aquimaris]